METLEKLVVVDVFLPEIADIIEFSATNSFNRRKIFERHEVISGFMSAIERNMSFAVVFLIRY